MKWSGLTLLAVLALSADIDEQLAREGEADKRASEGASCWCKKSTASLQARKRQQDSELRFAETVRERNYYSNQRLHMEVDRHHGELAENQRSLDANAALGASSAASEDADKDSHETALRDVRGAMDAAPEDSQMHNALRGIERTFSDNLDQLNDAAEHRRTQMHGLREAKQRMLHLAHDAASVKMQRLADGQAMVHQLETEIQAYQQLSNADLQLSNAVDELCTDLKSRSQERQSLRQQAMISSAEVNADAAQKAASRSYSRLSLSSARESRDEAVLAVMGPCTTEEARERAEEAERRAAAAVEQVQESQSSLDDAVASSGHAQEGLDSMLAQIGLDAHLISQLTAVDARVKDAVEKLAGQAKHDRTAAPALFNKMLSKAKESQKADARLLTALKTGKAAASQRLAACTL